MRLADDLRTIRNQSIAEALSGGTATIYTAPMPPTKGGAITTQIALATQALPTGLSSVNGATTMNPPPPVVLAAGTAAWGRITRPNGTLVAEDVCGLPDSTALFRLKSLTIEAGTELRPLLSVLAEPD